MEARVGGRGLASELSDSPEKPGPDARLTDGLSGPSPLRTRRRVSGGPSKARTEPFDPIPDCSQQTGQASEHR